MRFWDLDSPEVAAADAEPWDGPFASWARPLPMRTLVRVLLAATALTLLAGVSILLMIANLSDVMVSPAVATANGVVVLAVGFLIPLYLLALPASTLRHTSAATGAGLVLSMGVSVTVGVWASGPQIASSTIFYLEALPFAYFAFRLRFALLATASAIGGFGIVVVFQDGWLAPGPHWLMVASTVAAVAGILGLIAERADVLAESEHEARVELAEVNGTLEERVASQVGEIERLGELRRFLTPQVADAVLSADAEAVTRPHRRRIAVFFCDLRGFTAFTKESEPEEVVADLDQYYRAVGEVLQRHGATIGGYAGDGIMAYFGDPVPHEQPARAAVAMVADLRDPLDALVDDWQRRGHDLSYGIGLACGYATLGVVGFDGRYDYTPLGGVVNLAARLCGRAERGQVLVDHATYAELDGTAVCKPVDGLELKGLGEKRAYALV